MSNYNLIIIEDEPLTREYLRSLVQKHANFSIVAEAAHGMEAMTYVERYKPDVLFLDIEMPVLNGFQLLEKLNKEKYRLLVFITAYGEYALDAFDAEAFDYLLKPIDEVRFKHLMARLEKQLKLLDSEKDQQIQFKVGAQFYQIPLNQILYLKSDHNYMLVILKDGQRLRTRSSLKAFLKRLDDRFVRVHRSYIINRDEIVRMKHICQGDYVFILSNKSTIPSSKSYRQHVRSLMT